MAVLIVIQFVGLRCASSQHARGPPPAYTSVASALRPGRCGPQYIGTPQNLDELAFELRTWDYPPGGAAMSAGSGADAVVVMACKDRKAYRWLR